MYDDDGGGDGDWNIFPVEKFQKNITSKKDTMSFFSVYIRTENLMNSVYWYVKLNGN